MIFYIIIFCILGVFSLFEIFGLTKKDRIYVYYSFCLLFFVLSFLRWKTGTDWSTYYDYFQLFDDGKSVDFIQFEWGYSLINKIVKLFTDNFTVLLFILGVILFTYQSLAISKMSPYPILSLLFLWAIMFGNVLFVRQTIAIVILFYSVRYIEQRCLWKFIIFILFAMSFHRTSVLFIFAWWIYNIKWSPWKMFLVLCVSILFSTFVAIVLNFFGAFLGDAIQMRINLYLSEGYVSQESQTLGVVGVIVRGVANKVLFLIISFFILNKKGGNTIYFRKYLNLYWFGTILYFSTISISIVLARVSYPYDIFQIIIVSFFFKEINNNYVKLVSYFVLLLYLYLRMTQILNGPYFDYYIPFKTIFN